MNDTNETVSQPQGNETLDLKAFRNQYQLLKDKKTVVFSLVNIKDEETGELYTGDFEMKLFLTLKERSLAAAAHTRRNIGIDPFDDTYKLNRIVCELQASSIVCPDWFKEDKAFSIVGIQPIDRIYTLVKAAQEEYRDLLVAGR